MTKMTASDWRTLCYFWQDKGDVTRWMGWDNHVGEIQQKYPALVFAIAQKEIAEKMIDAVIEKIEREIVDD